MTTGPAGPRTGPLTGNLAGYGVLLRQHLRQDWWQVLLWAAGVTVLYYSQAISIDGLYSTQAELDRAAATMGDNAAFVAMAGPARALNTIGGQVFWQSAAFGSVAVGLMSMFLVGRHTRAEEETGRDELLRAAPLGRLAPVASAATVAAGANVVIGVAVAASLAAYPLPSADSWATGLGLTLVGWMFTATAIVAAQLTTGVRSMYGVAGAVLAAAFLLRAIGDVSTSGLSWLTPIGWYQALHPYSGLRWWPALLLAAGVVVSLGVAGVALAHRDAGAGLFAARTGPARGRIRGATGLVWRLQGPAALGWGVGLFLTGVAYGSIGDQVGTLIGDSQGTRDILAPGGVDLVDGFYATAAVMLALLATGFAVSSALGLRGEESAGRVEVLLSTGLSRGGWLLAHSIVTAVASLLVVAAAGVGLALGFVLATGEPGEAVRLATPVMAYVAPVWVCAALGLALSSRWPRWASLAWVVVGWASVVLFFGETLRLPGWLRDLSPYDLLALAPARAFELTPVLVLVAVAALLVSAARWSLERRDIE